MCPLVRNQYGLTGPRALQASEDGEHGRYVVYAHSVDVHAYELQAVHHRRAPAQVLNSSRVPSSYYLLQGVGQMQLLCDLSEETGSVA